jgi:hypothetical protein
MATAVVLDSQTLESIAPVRTGTNAISPDGTVNHTAHSRDTAVVVHPNGEVVCAIITRKQQ